MFSTDVEGLLACMNMTRKRNMLTLRGGIAHFHLRRGAELYLVETGEYVFTGEKVLVKLGEVRHATADNHKPRGGLVQLCPA